MKAFKSFLWLELFICYFVMHLNIANAFSIVHPENGLYSIRPECALDKVLSVQGASKNWDSNVIIDNFNSNGSTWRLTRVDGDWYTITAIHSDLALNVSNTQTSTQAGNGLNISTTLYRGGNQNKFRFFDVGNGYYVIQACIPGNYVLDVFNRDNQAGTNVWCYSFNNTPAQKWKLERKNSINDPTFQQRTVTIPDGWYRIQPMHDLGRSVDALGSQIGNGNNIHMWTNVEASQQKFYLQNRGNGYFSLQSAYGSKLFVTADGRGNGANLYTASWNNFDSQLFRLVVNEDNSYHIFSKVGVNLNFDCAGGGKSDGNNVQLWTTENNAWHKWKFTKVAVDNKANFQMESYNLSCPSDHQLKFTGKLWNANNNAEITGIHVYIGGGVGAGGEFIGEFRADKDNHRFDSILNVPSNRNGNQLIAIYAVNGVESKELDRRNINVSSIPTSDGLLYPMQGNINITNWSATLKNSGGIKCDYKAAQGENTEIRAPSDGWVEFRQTYSTKYNAMISYANHIIFTTTIGNDNYEIKCCHLSRFVGAPNDSRVKQKSLTRSSGRGCGESDRDPDGELYGAYKATIILGNTKVRVSKNQLLGYAGMTGNANGIHVHMEVRKNGKIVDPKLVFKIW